MTNKLLKSMLYFMCVLFLAACSEQTSSEQNEAKPKNILFITHTSTMGGKGVYSIYKESKKLGHDVKIAVIPQIYFGKLLADVDLKFAALFDSKDVIYPCGKQAPYSHCSSLKQYKLDYIFTQNPYDYFNESILEENFNISNLRKIAKVNYIIYGLHVFHQDTINDPNLPNIVDTVFVDSDSTKDIYINKYNFPEERVVVSGYQAYKNVRDLKNTIKKDPKETILYMPRWLLSFKGRLQHEGGSTFLNYHYFFYNFAKNNPQIDFIIRPHALLYSHAVDGDYLSQKDLDQIFNKFRSLDNIVISSHIETSLIEDILKSDIIISDGSSALGEAVVADKPIIYLSNGADIEFESNVLSKELKKNIFLAYEPQDIKFYIESIRRAKYSPNALNNKAVLDRRNFKKMLDPIENPAKYIAEYLLYIK